MPQRSRNVRAPWRGIALALAVVLLAGTAPAAANPKYAGVVYDVIGGTTLYADDADEKRYPASLTKVMTLYVVFEELAAGNITLDTLFTVSRYAAARPPSKIGFKPGGTIKVRDAIMALVTKSANDVASAVAENISGSEAAFARRMTKTARRLGMNATTFRNASGLPNAKQVTTARDMVKLGIAIQRDFPQYYGVFETQTFAYGERRYRNHNRLLGRIDGVDGIKTGFIRASGFNLLTSIRRDGRHLVAVVMGGRTGASRNAHMAELLAEHLPKGRRGQPMVFAAWNGSGPPPVPRAKPDLRDLFASRLVAQVEREDPIADKVLAFAAATRGAVGEAVAAPRTASDVIEAVIADAASPADPATEGGLAAVVAPVSMGAAAAPARITPSAPDPEASPADDTVPAATRFSAAFAMTERPSSGRLDSAALAAAIERARGALVPGADGGPLGARRAGRSQLGPARPPSRRTASLSQAVAGPALIKPRAAPTLPVGPSVAPSYTGRGSAGFRLVCSRQESRHA